MQIIEQVPISGDERCRFSSFLASQRNQTVFETVGDLVAEFPGNCVDIPYSALLLSEALAEDIIWFHNTPYEPAMKITNKAGHAYAEDRDVASPMMVTEYLTCTLADSD